MTRGGPLALSFIFLLLEYNIKSSVAFLRLFGSEQICVILGLFNSGLGSLNWSTPANMQQVDINGNGAPVFLISV